MPLPRLRIRTLMILVAVVAVVMGVIVTARTRYFRFREMARYHFDATGGPILIPHLTEDQIEQYLDKKTGISRARRLWHRRMGEKYYIASQHPWRPVPSDPPMPP